MIRTGLLSAYGMAGLLLSATAHASDGIAVPGQLGFQEPATPVMERLVAIHDHFLLYIITAVSILVLALLAYVCVRFNAKANPVPSKTSHNTLIEILWTAVPILILVAIAVPSLRLHYAMDVVPEAQMTIKATGHQWYWEYAYPEAGISFESRMVQEKDLKQGQPRLLAVDNEVVVPVDTVVRVQITGADVIHAWSVAAFGVKMDAIPGRLNETWFKATRTGVFYGQCSELCGVDHAFMPIAVRVVSAEDYAAWVASKKPLASLSEAQPAPGIHQETKEHP